jgi:glycosyltransferase involved in cell wall biosynthesis
MATAAPLRALLIAEACNPTWTSVPLVGYNFARALARRRDLEVTVVTHIRNQAALAGDPLVSLSRVVYIDTEWLAGPLYRLARWLRGGDKLAWTIDTALAWPAYMAFEHAVFRMFHRSLHQGHFDLIHRVTPLSPTFGSPLAGLTPVPMLLGPLNGGLPYPKAYPALRGQGREWLVPLRRLYRGLPYYHSAYRRLAGVIAGSRHTATEIPRSFRGCRFYLPENGVDPDRFPLARAWPEPAGRFRFISVGRLVLWKGFDLILEALAWEPSLRNCELRIVGDGPDRPALEALVRQLRLEGQVRFLGWLDQVSLARELSQAQVFTFPSLREFGGGVVLEALASGLPAVVVDYGGPGELVTPECGVALPLLPRPALVAQLRETMAALAGDPARCRALGGAACRRVAAEFTWTAKAGRLVEMYRRVLGLHCPELVPAPTA